MPVITGLIAGLTALETAGAGLAAAAGSTAAAGATAAAAGGATVAGAAGLGASLGAGAGIGSAALTAAAVPAAATTAAAASGGIGLGTLATGIGVAGTAASLGAQGLQMHASMQATAEQQRQEALRAKQMQLDADRQRRDVIRQTQISQAIGINNAAGSGASIDSSALSGIIGQNTTNAGYALNSINQNEAIGSALFSSNARESADKGEASLFNGISTIGQQAANNNMPIARVLKTTLFNG